MRILCRQKHDFQLECAALWVRQKGKEAGSAVLKIPLKMKQTMGVGGFRFTCFRRSGISGHHIGLREERVQWWAAAAAAKRAPFIIYGNAVADWANTDQKMDQLHDQAASWMNDLWLTAAAAAATSDSQTAMRLRATNTHSSRHS